MNTVQDKQYSILVKKISLIFLCFFLAQLLVGSFLIYQIAIKQTTEALQQTAQRVREDIVYQNGKWDTKRYNADPNVPDTYPLYVLSADGFVIDRWKPLHGFLDTSDVKHLLAYRTPQTITTPTNQTWRMLSLPIIHNNETVGVITVSSFNPSVNTGDIDDKLQGSAAIIASKIAFKNTTIDTSNLDPRDLSFDIAFQVVDAFNRIVTKNNNTNSIDRIPNYIDTSYIGNIVDAPVRQIKDSMTGEDFLIVTMPIVDKNNFIVGIIVIGRSIAYITQILTNFVIAEALIGGVLVFLFSFLMHRNMKGYVAALRNEVYTPQKKRWSHISFDKKEGSLLFDDEEVVIPYATNQYYLCEALFSHPKKRWEIDELLEKFGEQDLSNWRKVYDAMLIVNKKAGQMIDEKLIIARDKTYQLNPLLLPKIV